MANHDGVKSGNSDGAPSLPCAKVCHFYCAAEATVDEFLVERQDAQSRTATGMEKIT